MRISCNGCRVLRKGCSDDCTLRPSLEWLNSPQSQSNATLFLAKFYGRAGLLNLIAAAPTHRRPDIFRSLLYEACGRMINPVHGSVGLMSSGDWPRCHAAVEAVLGGRQNIAKARVRTRTGNRRKRSASTSEAKFTITGWDSKDFVIAPSPRPSHDSSSVETADPSLMRFQFHQGTIPEPPLTLELSLQCGCLR